MPTRTQRRRALGWTIGVADKSEIAAIHTPKLVLGPAPTRMMHPAILTGVNSLSVVYRQTQRARATRSEGLTG